MVTFKINDIDISNDVLLNTFNYMQRIDELFGIGSFQFESKTITENIPPYSVLVNNDKYYCCSSEATYHYGRQSWFHNVSIIEATSILSRFLVGSKAFSITGTNTYDYEKIAILVKLVEQKYGVEFEFDFEINKFNKQIEYVFGAGTTLFDALNEIYKQYNSRVYVSKIIQNEQNTIITLSVQELFELNNLVWDEKKILSKTKIQNPENYCKFLESEAKNVIDTNQTTLVSNLYPSATDIKLSQDTLVFKLPTPIYKLNSFKIANSQGKLKTQITTKGKFYLDSGGNNITKTYGEWANQYSDFKEIYNQYYSEFFDWTFFKNTKWTGNEGIYTPEFDNITHVQQIEGTVKNFDLTDHILSKEKYELLLDQDKPDYAYYTMGSNIIDGFNIFYKNSFWETVIGQTKAPFILRELFDDYRYQGEFYKQIGTSDYIQISEWELIVQHQILNQTYNIEYYPLTNPIIIEEKNDIPSNESVYKPFALSYGNASNYIDFDKLNNSMAIENNSIGKVEMVIEYDTTESGFGFDSMRKVTVDNKEWYIISSETTYNGTQQISKFNLVSEYNKTADIISLNSQYNTVNNPLQDIIERPIYIETNDQFIFTKGKTYIELGTFDNNNNIINTMYFTPAILKQNDTYLYFEMLDQYSAGTNATEINSGVYKLSDVGYVDENNEVYNIAISLVDINDLTIEQAKKMPLYNGTNYEFNSFIDLIDVYKDAREKLTFTIKAKNCIIK